MRHGRVLLAGAVCAALWTGACGTDEDDTPGLTDGLDSDALVSELAETERERLCNNLATWSQTAAQQDGLKHAACLLTAGFAAAFSGDQSAEATCATAYDSCIETKFEPDEAAASCSADDFATCELTVQQVERCMKESQNVFVDLFANLTCQDISAPLREDSVNLNDALNVCPDLVPRCPGLLAEDAPDPLEQ